MWEPWSTLPLWIKIKKPYLPSLALRWFNRINCNDSVAYIFYSFDRLTESYISHFLIGKLIEILNIL